MNGRWQTVATAIAFLLGLVACSPVEPTPTAVVPPIVLGEIEKEDGYTFGPEIVETMRVLNCDNPVGRSDVIIEVKSISRNVQTELVGEVGASVDVSAIVTSASVEASIANGYTLAVNEELSRGREIELSVGPNSSVEYDIVWKPVLWHGFLPIYLQSGEARIKYIYQQVAFGEVGEFRDRTTENCGVTADSTAESEPTVEQEATEVVAEETVEPEATPEQPKDEVATSEPAATAEPTASDAPVEETSVGRIVYTCYDGNNDQICIMDADGANQSQLTYIARHSNSPDLSPKGDQIAFSSNRDGKYVVYTMNSDGSDPIQISPAVGESYFPEYSPDGSKVVFSYLIDEAAHLMIREIDGSSNLVELGLDAPITSPVWSPDGSKIAFKSYLETTEASGEFYIVSSDGSDMQQLETGLEITGTSLDFSPDGKWLAIYAGEKGQQEIYLVAIDDSDRTRLTENGDNLSPSFSRDGKWIAFTSYRDGGAEIYKMRIDGSEITRLTSNAFTDYQPSWGR